MTLLSPRGSTATRRHKNCQKVKCLSLLTHSSAQAFNLWYLGRNYGRRGLAAQDTGRLLPWSTQQVGIKLSTLLMLSSHYSTKLLFVYIFYFFFFNIHEYNSPKITNVLGWVLFVPCWDAEGLNSCLQMSDRLSTKSILFKSRNLRVRSAGQY